VAQLVAAGFLLTSKMQKGCMMPRYYFHVLEHGRFSEDDHGVTLANAIDARREAAQAAREILSEKVALGEHIDGQVFVVCDDDGVPLFELPFKDVLNL
jgi:hypothetical protein